jgi:hypothetical protein
MSAEDELKRIELEIEEREQNTKAKERGNNPSPSPPKNIGGVLAKKGSQPPKKNGGGKPKDSLDVMLALVVTLTITAFGVNIVRQIPDEQAKTLRDGLIGGAAGLLVGYVVGRFRP